ncbi:CIC11C00000001528 [Sungouiella intermedia]|uniref:CIC11C00000001528 n=1 Tax=Sungouiella intermedia TaxID=45354 RepID=A0A1L0C525_9ASCO|nr:CIC11C00000001528 [[Candida] intermedia]
MAKLSIGSQHYNAKSRRSSMINSTSSQGTQNSVVNSSQTVPLEPESKQSRDIDSYMVQNKLLAIKNAELTQRIADLESKIAQLVTENVALQNSSESESKFRIQNTLEIVESVMADRFTGILQEIESIRRQEKLPLSTLLSTLQTALASCGPMSSTPRADGEDNHLGIQAWGNYPLDDDNDQGSENSKERSVSVASLADLAMLEDLGKSSLPETTQNLVGKLLLPELSTKVSVYFDKNGVAGQSTPLLPIEENDTPRKRTRSVTKTETDKQVDANGFQDIKRESRPRKRKPLSNVTNRRRSVLRRKAKEVEEVDSNIFDFVDQHELENQAKSH